MLQSTMHRMEGVRMTPEKKNPEVNVKKVDFKRENNIFNEIKMNEK